MTVDSSGPSTRLVVTKMSRVLHAITEFEGHVDIVFADPVVVKPASRVRCSRRSLETPEGPPREKRGGPSSF